MVHQLRVICENWADEGLNLKRSPADDFFQYRRLMYETYYKKDSNWILLHSSEESRTPLLHLPVNPRTELKVKIIDTYNSYAEMFLIAHVQPFTSDLKDMQALIKGDSSPLKFSTLSKDYQDNLRIQNAIAAHLNYKPKCNSGTVLSESDKKQLRDDLMDSYKTTSVWLETSSSLKQGASTLNQLIRDTNGISSESAVKKSNFFFFNFHVKPNSP